MRGKIGSLTGTMAAGENIIETIAEKERSATKKYTNSAGFSILKMAVSAAPGTKFAFNGADIVLPASGVFEIDLGLTEVESLVFENDVEACIVYLF